MIVGMETWEEAAIVAEIGSRAQVPVLSFSAPPITPPSMSLRWPYLIRLASNDSQKMKCIAALAQSYNWRRVVAIYEENAYGGDSGKLDLFSEALHNIGSEIVYRLVLPPISSVSDPEEAVRGELEKVKNQQSRVFIVLQSSLPTTIHLFREARETGLMGKDSAWIITDTIANYLDSLNSSVISSMEGTLGIKNYYSEKASPYIEFSTRFRRNFITEYPEEDYFHVQPGIHALRAFDSIRVISEALERLKGNINNTQLMLKSILSSNFTGLSGRILFQKGELLSADILGIVNVVGRNYKELDIWFPKCEVFFNKNKLKIDDPGDKNCSEVNYSTEDLADRVTWPGNLKRVPKGWAMPTDEKKMKIGVPSTTFFEMFVKFDPAESSDEKRYSGFCIDLFREVIKHLDYTISYEFVPHSGSYDNLIMGVYHKVMILII